MKQNKKPGRKPLPDAQLSVKRSVSMPPEMWAWIEQQAGTTGVPARIIQQAIRLLQNTSSKVKASAEKDFRDADAAEQIGNKKIAQSGIKKKNGRAK